jgi:L-ascorbate metabolism protein UlaG (beta-lactamase superfamily)
MSEIKNKNQARAPKTELFGAEAFAPSDKTIIRWLGNAGTFINSQGTCIMIDPLLEGFDLPLIIDMPILPENVPHLDAILVTHCDNDHFSRVTCKKLKPVCKEYHAPQYVSELMKEEELPGLGHNIGETFEIGTIKATLTPADHAWQNEKKKYTRVFKFEDYCGFWLETPDGTVWVPGDSRLLPEHLEMPTPDAIIFDFSDNSWHIGLQGAAKLANAYPNTPLLLSHFGSVDAPNMDAFNADPDDLYGLVKNPERIYVLAPGEAFTLSRLNETEK